MDPRTEPGRYYVQLVGDEEYPFYWHAYLGELRINGGVCKDYTQGATAAKDAIAKYRHRWVLDNFYWDVETGQYCKKGELPPPV